MKKILICALIILAVFLIYLGTIDKKVYYLSLGDSYAVGITPYGNKSYSYGDYIKNYLEEKNILETYIKDYAEVGYRTVDLIRDITDNKKIIVDDKEKTIKNALIKADLVTVSIGTNDIISKLSTYQSFAAVELYKHLDEFLNDLDKLLEIVREYCKEDIILLGYYNFLAIEELDPLFDYINKKASEISEKYKINFINLDNTFKEFQENPRDIHPNEKGYREIYNKMKEVIDKKVLK